MELKITITTSESASTQTYDNIETAIEEINNYFTRLTGSERPNLKETFDDLFSNDIFKEAMYKNGVVIPANRYDGEISTICIQLVKKHITYDMQRVCAVIIEDDYKNMLESCVYQCYHIVETITAEHHDVHEKIIEFINNPDMFMIENVYNGVPKIVIYDRTQIPHIEKIEDLALSKGIIIKYIKQIHHSFDSMKRFGVPYYSNCTATDIDVLFDEMQVEHQDLNLKVVTSSKEFLNMLRNTTCE